MTAQSVTPRVTRYGEIGEILRDQSVAAISTSSEGGWIVPCYGRIKEVFCHSGTAGSGGTSDIVDVLLNGTTIFTTQDNRPTLLVGDTGVFTQSGLGTHIVQPEVDSVKPGDKIKWVVDQQATTGSALFTITILISRR